MEELNKLWRELGDVPVNNRDETEQSFLHFPAGRGQGKSEAATRQGNF